MMTVMMEGLLRGQNLSLIHANLSEELLGCTGLDCHSDALFNMATALTVTIAVFGAVGNMLSILAILTSSLRNNRNSILICNLSVADTLYCTFVLPLQAVIFYNKALVFSDVLCQLHAALRIWLIGVNMLLLSSIAVYRFLHVIYPEKYRVYSQSPWFMRGCIICFALPFFFCSTPLVGLWGTFGFEERILQCTFSCSSSRSHKFVTITTGYVVPFLLICACYARITVVVFNTRMRAIRGSQHRKQRARRESFRLTGMMSLIIFGFMLGTTPFFMVNIFDPKLRHPLPHIWASFVAWTMYMMNPVIYTLMDTKFQRACIKLFQCKILKNDRKVQERFTPKITGMNERLNP